MNNKLAFALAPFVVVLFIGLFTVFCLEMNAGARDQGRQAGRLQALEHICKQVCAKAHADHKIVEGQDCWCMRDIGDDNPIGVPALGVTLYEMEKD